MPTGHYIRTKPNPMKGRRYRSVDERWEEKFIRRGPDECWPWIAGKFKVGYGSFYESPTIKHYAHRFAWERHNDRQIPAGMVVMHSCDNMACVNPAHLSLGTHADNVADKVRKGRQGARRRLTPEIVRGIRAMRADTGATYKAIGEHFGASENAVANIIKGKDWRWVK